MRFRIVSLWGLMISCAQINAQEIFTKFEKPPLVEISNDLIRIDVDYSCSNAKGKEIKLLLNICDENNNVLWIKEQTEIPTDNDLMYYGYSIPCLLSELNDYKNSALHVSAALYYSIDYGMGHNWAFTKSKNFYVNSTSTNSNTHTSASVPNRTDVHSNLVDNGEKIRKAEKHIKELEYKKQHCSYCHGTGSVPKLCMVCYGTGTYKIGYYPPQYFTCRWCQGTGKDKTQCMTCFQTNMAIRVAKQHLENLKETHGMTKETERFYYEHKSKMAQMDRDYQNSINAIAEPYLNSTRKSKSSNSYTSSSSKCSICNGTGIDPHTYYSGDPKPWVGGYTHSSGGKCIYCEKYQWHQHVYCPKCNANKYP